MDIAAWIAFMIGIAAGGSIIYIRQRKLRMEELEKAVGKESQQKRTRRPARRPGLRFAGRYSRRRGGRRLRGIAAEFVFERGLNFMDRILNRTLNLPEFPGAQRPADRVADLVANPAPIRIVHLVPP